MNKNKHLNMPTPSTPTVPLLERLYNKSTDISTIHQFSSWTFLIPLHSKSLYKKSLVKNRGIKCRNCPKQDKECIECEYKIVMAYERFVLRYFKQKRNRHECPFGLHNMIIRGITYTALYYLIQDNFPNSDKAQHKLLEYKIQIQRGYKLARNSENFKKLYPEEQRKGEPLSEKAFIMKYW